MKSVPLVKRGKLFTTSLEANVASVVIGLTIGQMIRSVEEIVGDLMVEFVRILVVIDLVVILPHRGLMRRSL